MDEVVEHRRLVDYIGRRTGLDAEKIMVILYAGEPWIERERFSAALLRAFQYAEQSGTGPAGPLDAIFSLLRLEDGQGTGETSSREARLEAKVQRVSVICRERTDTVREVVEAMMQYYAARLTVAGQSRRDYSQS